jgi:hypothetical protein
MALRHLRYLVTVAQERNFIRAAEKFCIAQPPLSRQIRYRKGLMPDLSARKSGVDESSSLCHRETALSRRREIMSGSGRSGSLSPGTPCRRRRRLFLFLLD